MVKMEIFSAKLGPNNAVNIAGNVLTISYFCHQNCDKKILLGSWENFAENNLNIKKKYILNTKEYTGDIKCL